MDIPTANQLIEFSIQDFATGALAVIGMSYTGGIRHAYAQVTDVLGNNTAINTTMSVDGAEHDLRIEFSQTAYSFYIDNVLIGTQALAANHLQLCDYAVLTQQPVVAGSIMSVSKVELTDCAL